jgi:hypothetical protein
MAPESVFANIIRKSHGGRLQIPQQHQSLQFNSNYAARAHSPPQKHSNGTSANCNATFMQNHGYFLWGI